MDSNTALKPTIFNDITQSNDKQVGNTEEEQHLYSLSKQKGWEIITEFKERIIKDLEDSNKGLMSSGQNFEEIGKNAVVINLAESIVDRVLNLVNDAKEACEANEK